MSKNLTGIKVVVWSKDGCPHCVTAKETLKRAGAFIEERNITSLDKQWTKEDLLKAIPDARTLPQIVVNGFLIGGMDKLRTYMA